jgi:hypothetical protein
MYQTAINFASLVKTFLTLIINLIPPQQFFEMRRIMLIKQTFYQILAKQQRIIKNQETLGINWRTAKIYAKVDQLPQSY